VTTRTPLEDRNAQTIRLILALREAIYFFARGLDDPNQLELVSEIRFFAQAVLTARKVG
jgi:hypothetical protein